MAKARFRVALGLGVVLGLWLVIVPELGLG
jgi:hypothetical protein